MKCEKNTSLALAALVAAWFLSSAAAAQFNYFPGDDETRDGRFLALAGTDFATFNAPNAPYPSLVNDIGGAREAGSEAVLEALNLFDPQSAMTTFNYTPGSRLVNGRSRRPRPITACYRRSARSRPRSSTCSGTRT